MLLLGCKDIFLTDSFEGFKVFNVIQPYSPPLQSIFLFLDFSNPTPNKRNSVIITLYIICFSKKVG